MPCTGLGCRDHVIDVPFRVEYFIVTYQHFDQFLVSVIAPKSSFDKECTCL